MSSRKKPSTSTGLTGRLEFSITEKQKQKTNAFSFLICNNKKQNKNREEIREEAIPAEYVKETQKKKQELIGWLLLFFLLLLK